MILDYERFQKILKKYIANDKYFYIRLVNKILDNPNYYSNIFNFRCNEIKL